jgi:hypothetical protein
MTHDASNDSRDAASFRDPSGFIFRHNGIIYRQVNVAYQTEYDLLMASGLYQALVDEGLLLPHQEVKLASVAKAKEVYKILKPQQLPFISYPYEWSFSQLQDAALATLRLQKIAMDHGMSLKDASAYNIQWLNGKPVFIDTLSFEAYAERPWVAYRQFCQHFLAPLTLMSMVDIRLGKLLREYVDGIPLELVTKLLPVTARLRPSLLAHIFLHAGSQQKHAKPQPGKKVEQKALVMPKRSLNGLLDSLQSGISGLKWKIPQTEWADYYAANNNYQSKAMKAKHKLVEQFVDTLKPAMVWDLGGNTGEFSRLFSAQDIDTVCWDIDPVAVEMNYQLVKKQQETHLYPVMQDFTNPSPAIGWNGQERMSLFERGPVDAVLALALVHHLAIANNVPLTMVASFMRGLAKKGLVIEFIPKEDSQVQLLLSSREDIFVDYTKEGFEAAFSQYFKIKEAKLIPGSKRTLYLMEAK